MTDTEKKIMLRLCAKVMEYADFATDKEAEHLVNWVLLFNERKQNNNEIRRLMAVHKEVTSEKNGSIKAALERGKAICEKRDQLYEGQQKIKHKLWKLEKEI
jgi:hypothetical protein